MQNRLVLATRNAHKIVEVSRILARAGATAELVGLGVAAPELGDIPETGTTFVENALIKARVVCEATGLPALADDSGLAVDALNAMPGVLSARWSGGGGDEANTELVLAQLADVPLDRRGARFSCAAAAVFPDGREVVAEGELRGTLTTSPRGTNGFGYDPIFVPNGYSITTAQMTGVQKDEISHRGRAFRALADRLWPCGGEC